MAIRGKLISATNILLEHPLFQPVEDAEFVIVGKKEYDRTMKKRFWDAFYLGVAVGAAGFFLVVASALVLTGAK